MDDQPRWTISPVDDSRTADETRSERRRRAIARGLVLCAAEPPSAAPGGGGEADARRADPDRPRRGRCAFRVARSLPTPRHAAQRRPFRRAGDRMLLSRLAVRHARAMHPDPVAGAGPELYARPYPHPPLSGARGPGQHLGVFRRGPGGGAGHPGARRVRWTRARPRRERPVRRGDRSCGDRADGPGARAFRASRLVVALAPVDPAKGQGLRPLPVRLCDDPPRAVAQFAGLPAAGRRPRNRDRLPPAEHADRADSRRPPPGEPI